MFQKLSHKDLRVYYTNRMRPRDLEVNRIVQQGYDEMPTKPFHNSGHSKRVHDAALSIGSVEGEDKVALRIAAAYHDVGHSSGAAGHEQRSANRVENVLINEGIHKNSDFIQKVKDIILSTKMDPSGPFHPNVSKGGRLGKTLADADVHNFGLAWDDFYVRTNEVRKEQGVGSEEDWFRSTINLLESHSWHAGGGSVYGNKDNNIARMRSEIQDD